MWREDLDHHHWLAEDVYLWAERHVIDHHHSHFMFAFADLLEEARELRKVQREREESEQRRRENDALTERLQREREQLRAQRQAEQSGRTG